MITVRLSRGRQLTLRVRGHALSAPHGRDIVCAAVSVLTINTANAIETLAHLPSSKLETQVRDGDFTLRLRTDQLTQKERNIAFLLLESFLLGIRSLEEEYPEFITYREGGGTHDKNESAIIRQQKGSRKLQKRSGLRSPASRRKAYRRPGCECR